MKNKKSLAIILIMCLSLSIIGCGNTKENANINNTENAESISKEVIETEQVESTENNEPTYTEYDTYFLQNGVDSKGNQYDMSTMTTGTKNYTLIKSVNIYYLNENRCGYTKENVVIQVISSNDDYCYVNLDHKYFLMKTKDVEDAKFVDETENVEKNDTQIQESEKSSNSSTKETTKKDASTKQNTSNTKNESANTNNNTSNNDTSNTAKEEQPTNSEPKVEETQPQEQPTTSNKYTPDEAISYFRSQIEAQGMQWTPSIKDEASWGTGWIPLSKDELNASYISNAMAGFNYGNGDGTPMRRYYLEVTGSDSDYVYVTIWNA